MTNDYQSVKRIVTVCALRHGDQFLLLKRNKEPHKGRYSPVGGKVEPKESPRQAAVRETFEETGLQLRDADLKLAGILTETSPTDYNWVLYVYYADIEMMAPPDCNEGVLEWVKPFDLDPALIPPTDFYFYEAIAQKTFFVLDALYDEDEAMILMTDEVQGTVLFSKEKDAK